MLIKHKLHRWEAYLDGYSLPDWIDIPDMGLYMDQLVGLLSHYLNFIPLVDGSQKPITPSTINNYVRLKVMPAPHKRKYYRIHIAYLIMIFTLKQSVSIACVQQLLPWNLTEAQTCGFYNRYAKIAKHVGHFFNVQTRAGAKDIFNPPATEYDPDEAIEKLIIQTILMGGFSAILAQKLLLLSNADPEEVLKKELLESD